LAQAPGGKVTFSTGAQPPSTASFTPGYTVPLPPVAAGAGAPPVPPAAALPAIAHDIPNWPVRDQFYRGTCVSFATTACREHVIGGATDLSEQFLYWAIKTKTADPWQVTDGTLLEYARSAIASEGTCEETYWQYHPNFIPGNVSQQSATEPSAQAVADGATRLTAASAFQNNFPTGGFQPLLTLKQAYVHGLQRDGCQARAVGRGGFFRAGSSVGWGESCGGWVSFLSW
jgi:hypothetical protein